MDTCEMEKLKMLVRSRWSRCTDPSGPGREMDEERSFSFPELSGDFGGDHVGLRSQNKPSHCYK